MEIMPIYIILPWLSPGRVGSDCGLPWLSPGRVGSDCGLPWLSAACYFYTVCMTCVGILSSAPFDYVMITYSGAQEMQ